MRTDISTGRHGWLYRLDYKKLIIIVFLLRIMLASAYDIFVTVNDKDLLVPDSKFYSIRGRYIDLLFQGYGRETVSWDMLPRDEFSRFIFGTILQTEQGRLPAITNEPVIYAYIIGIIYFLFGYYTIWVRVFNIILSILSVYMLFKVSKRLFGDIASNLFLVVALFLPTQFMYSVTLSRDFLRVFVFSVMIWAVYYMGDICIKRLKLRFFY